MKQQLIEQYKEKLLNNNIETYRKDFIYLKEELVNHNLVLIGLRQLGKTILAEQLVKDYLHIDEELDSIEKSIDVDSSTNQSDFLYLNLKSFPNMTSEEIQIFIKDNAYKIVFIDEIQVIKDWSNLVQVLVDMNKNTRFVFTGSNASALSRETALGRVKIFNIFPLDFQEFKDIWNIQDFSKYLYFGSYPRLMGYEQPEIQYRETLRAMILDKIATEDNEGISISKLTNFAEGITNYIGNEISNKGLTLIADLSRPTVKTYIKLMKEASLIQTITKYGDTNRNTKNKVYFVDKCMLPYFIDEDLNNNQMGSLIENTVYMFLKKKFDKLYGQEQIFYFRNSKGQEVDFIIPSQKLLIEVKHVKDLNSEELSNTLNSTIENEFKDYKKIVITKELEDRKNGWEFIPLMEYIGGI